MLAVPRVAYATSNAVCDVASTISSLLMRNQSIQNGAWNLAKVILPEARTLAKWAVVSVIRDVNESRAKDLMHGLGSTCRAMGELSRCSQRMRLII